MSADAEGPVPMQFDTAIPRDATGGDSLERVTCAACQRPIEDQYYDAGGQSVCEACRAEIARQVDTPAGWGVMARAALFAVGAAIAGAALYYAVIAITGFEIGIVAIAIGYMVGYATRAGAAGRGGRRFQVMALVLTYWAVGLGYLPMLFQPISDEPQQTEAAATSDNGVAAQAAPDVPLADANAAAAGDSSAAGLGVLLLGLSFALPVMVILGSLPGGLISAAIIAFGMHQAWRMTGEAHIEITGPYRISGGPAAPA